MNLNLIKKIYLFIVLSFLLWFSFSFNNSKSELIYNHLNSKYQTLSISEQQDKRKDIKSLFFQIKRKTDNSELINLVTELIEKVDRKIDALEEFKTAYNWNKTFEINLWNNVIIFTKDPNLLQTRNNSQRSTQKDIASDLDAIRDNILTIVNQEREKKWLNQLTIDFNLNKAAQGHAEYMAKTKNFNHTTKAGLEFHQRIKAAWYQWRTMWENIAYNQRSEQTVMEAWMDSPWHKANILDIDFTKIWIGFQDYYWVQNFGG